MTITINASGAERKLLVNTISQWLGEEPRYCGAPSFAYIIGKFTVDKDGTLNVDIKQDSMGLSFRGFVNEHESGWIVIQFWFVAESFDCPYSIHFLVFQQVRQHFQEV